MRNLILGIVLMATVFLWKTAVAQTLQEKRRIEEEKRDSLEEEERKILETEDRFIFDYGGWVNFRYDDYKDDDNDSSTRDTLDYTFSLDPRFWTKVTFRPNPGALDGSEHSLYIRLKDLFIWRRPVDVNEAYDQDGPHIDYAYSVLDFRPYYLEIGRRYFSVGQGIAYSNVNDGVEVATFLTNWNFKALVSHTLAHEDNIDTSIPGWGKKSERTFYGLEGTYLGIPNHGLYGYILIQRDSSNEEPEDFLHDYTYDSEYFGWGSQGKITKNIHYWLEIIRETGKSFVYATREKEDVGAWAGDLGISYDLETYSHPNFSIEYAFGSGDPDRTNVTDTQNGNTIGDDRNFLYFGYLPSGYALSPRLSNIHFYKVGVLLKPLEKYHSFKNLTLGIDYYRYYKDRRAGGIYDTDASMNDKDVGSEIDLTVSWQIFSDLKYSLEFGYFNPGKAYPDSGNNNEKYFSLGMSYTF